MNLDAATDHPIPADTYPYAEPQTVRMRLHARQRKRGPLPAELLRILPMLLFSLMITAQSEWSFRLSIGQTLDFVSGRLLQFWCESLIVFLTVLLLYVITRRAYLAYLVPGIVFAAASTANSIMVSTRSEPLVPWDFKIIKDAGEIASRVSIHIPYELIVSYLFILACAAAAFFTRKRWKPMPLKIRYRVIISAVLLASGALFIRFVIMNDQFLAKHNIREITWSQVDNYQENGFIFSFLGNLSNQKVVKPAGYGKQTVENSAQSVSRSSTPVSTVKPNIIMIQDEALCDLTEFSNVKFSQSIMPEMESLRGNYISGHLLTPMFGGGTCNSEFEVLTGFSYSFLPAGSVPYEQYFQSSTFSYASFLKSIGYSTVAVHSFDRAFWDRDTVFPNIGFDKFIAEDNFKDPQLRRGFISDLDTMKMIVSQYQANKKTGKPFFNFTITMQNHFSWGENDYPADERVHLTTSGLTGEESAILTTYSTGVRDADAALKYLIQYFSQVKEPTIIVFYGDHMPALDQNTLINGGYLNGDVNSAENVQKIHSTPYIIWNNYNGAQAQTADMSMYELAAFMDKTFNLQRPLYFDFLEQQYDTFRGYATGVYLNSDGQPVMEAPAGSEAYRQKQYLFEYDLLIGNKYGTALTK